MEKKILKEKFRNWDELVKYVLAHLTPEADPTLVEYWLKELREQNPDLTVSELWEKIERAEEQDRPAVDIRASIDWAAVWDEELEVEKLLEAAEAIKTALEKGKIGPEDLEKLGLPRYKRQQIIIRNPRKWEQERENLMKRIAELEAKLAEAEKKKPAWQTMPISELYRWTLEEIRRYKGR